MELHLPPPELVPYGLRAMKMLACANGVFDDAERALLGTVQDVFGTAHDLDALPPIEPDELARKVTDPALRRQMLRGMVVLSLVDGEASPEEAELVGRFAAAFGIASDDVRALRELADGHLLRARFDIGRRFWARDKIVETTKARGVLWLAKTLATMAGLAEDTVTSAKYRSLGQMPTGSLGRGYFDFVTSNGFSFPGEKGSPPEIISLHDLTHVLSGYGTDPSGELEVLSFHAGCRREEKDPFSYVLFGLAEFHLGLAMSPVASGSKGMLDPKRALRALQRGAACKIDPTDGWDPWPVMHRSLVDLRREYGISEL